MIVNKEIDILINSANRLKYKKITGLEIKNGDLIKINQKLILPSARVEIDCICDICKKEFSRTRVNIKTTTTTCGNHCRNEWLKLNNPNPTKKKIIVFCSFCNKKFDTNEAKFKSQEYFLCSRECYSKHRESHYWGENLYNYQDKEINCETCGLKFKTSKWYIENKKHLFCSQQCYWTHRKTHYKEFYYTEVLNGFRKETKPERKIREWLESKGFEEGKDFFQECGFLKKYYADFYLPKYKMIIEAYGDYWHVNPEIYDTLKSNQNKKPMNEYQTNKVHSESDSIRQKELESYGYSVNVIWEKDIIKDVNASMSKIIKV